MNVNIPNVDSWLKYSLRSNEEFDIINIDTYYDAAIISLNKYSITIIRELERESAFNDIHLLVKLTREFVENADLMNKERRLKLLEDFEIILKRTFSLDRSSYKPLLKWTGQKEMLAEIFVHLKLNNNSENKPYLDNSYEDLALS